ncbi:histone H2B.2-like [Nicotiana tomentosiformis]|uniref:histone H2B.2-like n=1 Tax=Nicotiana tomentosiformis TaxID=4098 RepID=UPI00051B6716|nr:histone H2B.2-like [Nicotiana tomentosiformis]
MAPKKRGGRPRTTVVTARKVVEETVSVVVTSPAGETETETQTLTQSQSQPTVEIFSSSTKESFDILTPPPSEEPIPKRTISVEDKSTPQRKKKEQERQPQELEEQRVQQQDEDETQPASEPEEMPTPPKMQEEKKAKKRKPEAAKKTTQAKGGTEEERKRKRKRKRAKVGGGVGPSEGYRRYVFRVMKQVHPDMGISSKAMTILNNLMGDMFERIAGEAATLSKYVGRATLASVDIQDAVKLVLPGELGKHAIAEGTKAVTTYVSSVGGGDKSKSKSKSKT